MGKIPLTKLSLIDLHTFGINKGDRDLSMFDETQFFRALLLLSISILFYFFIFSINGKKWGIIQFYKGHSSA